MRKMSLVVLGSLVSSTLGTAYGHAGSYTSALNRYFLPANAPVSGISGLLFGVLLPVALVIILIYYGLSMTMENERVAKALSIIIGLFVIPSGGYKGISSLFISLFGVANRTGAGAVVPSTGPFSGVTLAAVLGVLTGIILAALFHRGSSGNITVGQAIMATIAGAFVYLLLSGQISFMSFVGTVIIAAIGWFIFRVGAGTGTWQGILVGVVGIFITLRALDSIGILPPQIQTLLSWMEGTGIALILVIVLAVIVILVLLADLAFGFLPSNPLR